MVSNSAHALPTPITEQVHLPGNCILHVTRLGTGPIPVICLHGGPGLWDYFSSLTPRLTSLATVHTYDQRSCGRSFPAPPPYTIATWIADLERLRVHWGVNRWVLLGHSFGATFALAYALAIPERCRGLIYVSGTGVADPGWHDRYRANRTTLLGEEGARELQEIKRKVKERPATVVPRAFAAYQTLERQACEMSWATDFACYATGPERAKQMVREQLLDECYWSPNFEVNRLLGEDAEKFAEKEDFDAKHRLDVALKELPVLVVHGEADPRPVDVARELAERIPDARFVKMSGIGHWPWLEDPEGFEKVTLEFLQSCKLSSETICYKIVEAE